MKKLYLSLFCLSLTVVTSDGFAMMSQQQRQMLLEHENNQEQLDENSEEISNGIMLLANDI
jgi:hypothetical protein